MAEAAVVKKESTAVANIMDDLYEAAGQGMETIGADDMQIPFLRILQPLSPQLIKTDPKFIKGASAGDIFNTVTGDYWEADEGVDVLMCAYTTKFLEFQLRENGGGFMGELENSHPDIRQTQRNGANEILPNGNELVRSAQFLVLAYDDNGMTTQMICDMKKTQMKIAKQWNTRLGQALLVEQIFALVCNIHCIGIHKQAAFLLRNLLIRKLDPGSWIS